MRAASLVIDWTDIVFVQWVGDDCIYLASRFHLYRCPFGVTQAKVEVLYWVAAFWGRHEDMSILLSECNAAYYGKMRKKESKAYPLHSQVHLFMNTYKLVNPAEIWKRELQLIWKLENWWPSVSSNLIVPKRRELPHVKAIKAAVRYGGHCNPSMRSVDEVLQSEGSFTCTACEPSVPWGKPRLRRDLLSGSTLRLLVTGWIVLNLLIVRENGEIQCVCVLI